MILPFEWQLIASVEIIIVWDDLEKDYGKIKNHWYYQFTWLDVDWSCPKLTTDVGMWICALSVYVLMFWLVDFLNVSRMRIRLFNRVWLACNKCKYVMIDRNLLEFDSFIYRSVRIVTVPYLDLIDRSIQYMAWGWGSCSKIVLLTFTGACANEIIPNG
jgi:hypothetical protein